MPFLSLLGSAKSILSNPYVLIGIALAGALTYHYFTVTGLEKDLAVTEKNYIQAKQAAEINARTVINMTKDVTKLKKDRNISDDSYIKEIARLKGLMFELEKKVVYKDKIIIKKIRVPVIVGEKTVYVDRCPDIPIHKLDNNDNNNSILRILSGVGR